MVNRLKKNGLVINPYGTCVANKMVKGEVITTVWHVDYINVSHKYPFEVTKFDQYLFTIYGNKPKVNRGKIHDYLGINLDYIETGVVKVLVIKYQQKVL